MVRRRGCQLSGLCVQLCEGEASLVVELWLASLYWGEDPGWGFELYRLALHTALHATGHR